MSGNSRRRFADGQPSLAPSPSRQPLSSAARDFFSGVDQLRIFLDRHLQDPERRHQRLAKLAEQIIRPRGASELGRWLVRGLKEAVGAEACVLVLRETDWQPWHSAGVARVLPPPAELAACLDIAGSAPPGRDSGCSGNWLLPVMGIEDAVGALWIEGCGPVVGCSASILQALVDTAGVMLENGLRVESLIRDPLTGLLPAGALLDRAAELLGQSAARGTVRALIAFRVAGWDSIVEAKRADEARQAVALLARAVEQSVPRTLVLGVRFDDIWAVVPEIPGDNLETTISGWARAVASRLRELSAQPGPALSAVAAYMVVRETIGDVLGPVERVSRRLAGASNGALLNVE